MELFDSLAIEIIKKLYSNPRIREDNELLKQESERMLKQADMAKEWGSDYIRYRSQCDHIIEGEFTVLEDNKLLENKND